MKATIAVKPEATVSNARGVFKRGDQVDWPVSDIQPLIDTKAAVEGWVDLEGEADPQDEEDDQGVTATNFALDRGHPLAAVEFASDEAAELALKESMGPEDFEDQEHTGATGFTVGDVRGILETQDEEEEDPAEDSDE